MSKRARLIDKFEFYLPKNVIQHLCVVVLVHDVGTMARLRLSCKYYAQNITWIQRAWRTTILKTINFVVCSQPECAAPQCAYPKAGHLTVDQVLCLMDEPTKKQRQVLRQVLREECCLLEYCWTMGGRGICCSKFIACNYCRTQMAYEWIDRVNELIEDGDY